MRILRSSPGGGFSYTSDFETIKNPFGKEILFSLYPPTVAEQEVLQKTKTSSDFPENLKTGGRGELYGGGEETP